MIRDDREQQLLRHRLNQLGYKESFTWESSNLIQHLLSDLIRTTESLRKFKTQSERVAQEKAGLEEQIKPLRTEIARLTAENNQVHLDILRIADERDARDRRFQQITRKMETEAGDLKFMNSQLAHKLDIEHRKNEEQRERAEDVFKKMGILSKETARSDSKGGKVNKLIERLQKIDLETGLEPLTTTPEFFPPPEPSMADVIKLSQLRVEQLEKKSADLEGKNADLENEMQVTRDQLNKREQEILRLGAQLEVSRAQQFSSVQVSGRPVGLFRDDGAPIDPAESIHQLPIARQRIEQLEQQIEYLQEHIESLEKEQSEVDETKQAFIYRVEDEKRALIEDLKKEREKSASLLRGATKLEKMVEELSAMRDSLITRERNGGAEPADLKVLESRIADLERQLTEKEKKIKSLESNLANKP
ncbi:hypothetical protein HDU76_006357, partial [Blyttiomyces sp. JEL0837]